MTQYFPIAIKEVGPFSLIFDYAHEDSSVRDCFDEDEVSFQNIEHKIRTGDLIWLYLRGRIFFEGVVLADQYVNALLYSDPERVMTDGTAKELTAELVDLAVDRIERIKGIDLSGLLTGA